MTLFREVQKRSILQNVPAPRTCSSREHGVKEGPGVKRVLDVQPGKGTPLLSCLAIRLPWGGDRLLRDAASALFLAASGPPPCRTSTSPPPCSTGTGVVYAQLHDASPSAPHDGTLCSCS